MNQKTQYAASLLLCLMMLAGSVAPAQGIIPNPIRAIVSTELEEPWEIYDDGGFEAGEHDIRGISPYQENPPAPPIIERTNTVAYSGNWAYRIENSGTAYTEFSVLVDPDKAETITFTAMVRAVSGEVDTRPFIVFEDNSELADGPYWGAPVTISENWTQVSFTASTTAGFRDAHAGIEVPPGAAFYIDDVSVSVPVWKESAGATTIGGVNVPAEPVAPVQICFSIHIEDPQQLVSSTEYFWRKTAVFEELAKMFHAHGGYLNIQPELEWALAAQFKAPNLLRRFSDLYGVTYSTHTHGPVCVGLDGIPYGSAYCRANHGLGDHTTNITDADIARYIDIRRQKFAAMSGQPVTDHNGNFEVEDKDIFFDKGIRTLSVFKNKYTQKGYDYLFTNPWRPSDADALQNIEQFIQHDAANKLIYIPGVGSNITKRHHRVPLKVRRFAGQFIRFAEAERVNAMNLILHVDAFVSQDPAVSETYIAVDTTGSHPVFTYSAEFLEHLQYWEDMLTETIDPLVAAGYLEWATHREIAAAFIDWEQQQTPPTDSIFTRIPSNAGGDLGIAVNISLPEQPRFNAAAPIAIHVPGGFSGSGLTMDGARLTEQGFIEIFFNFPGSGRPDSQSDGTYDLRGPLSMEALKDVARFAMGEISDQNGKKLAELIQPILPIPHNVGLVGWSNGGNGTISAAGLFAAELSNLAWIVNWESPVGDGMPGAEAGAKGESSVNPEQNTAYNPDTGEWDLSVLKYDALIDVNQHHATSSGIPLNGGLYFDLNGNSVVDEGVDFIPFPISMTNGETEKVYYSKRVTQYAEEQGLYPAGKPDHLTTLTECTDFWDVRNAEDWIAPVCQALPQLKFLVVASEIDHVQTAPDHPHVLIQYENFRSNGAAFVRLNPDRSYVELITGRAMPNCVDNAAFTEFDHQSIRNAVEPSDEPGLGSAMLVSAACCELADRTRYQVLAPQLDNVITGPTGISTNTARVSDFRLSCYPNPFNPATKIEFSLAAAQMVKIQIFDMLGRQVTELLQQTLSAGHHSVVWNATNDRGETIAAGVYFVKLSVMNETVSRKILYLP